MRSRGTARPVRAGDARFFALSLDLLAVAGFDGCLKRVNPAWERISGYSTAELTPRPYLEFVHPDDRERTASEAARLAQTGAETIDLELRLVTRDGEEALLESETIEQAAPRPLAGLGEAMGWKDRQLLGPGPRCRRAGLASHDLSEPLREVDDDETADASAALEAARSPLARTIAERGAQIDAGPLPTVQSSPSELTQLFQNLLSNALKFCDADTQLVEVSADALCGTGL